jgi:hypothetical protein
MKGKADRIVKAITGAISTWPGVECVTLGEHAEADVLDPHFALVIDAYLHGDQPPVEERQASFAAVAGQPGAFESSVTQSKDRFFVEELPLRVEYKRVEMIDEVIARSKEPDATLVWVFKNSGTHMLYRLQNSTLLYQKGDWLKQVRHDISHLPSAFWKALQGASAVKMEHYLADLGAASFGDDGYFYGVSMAGFTRYTAASLFMANRKLEPSHRNISARLCELKRLPDNFLGRWETLLRSDGGISAAQKYEVAELIARSVIAFE